MWVLSPLSAQQTLIVADAGALKTIFADPALYRKQMCNYE